MPQPRTHHWTYEEYLALPDDGTRCEIIDGERLMTPAPFTPHQTVLLHLGCLLQAFLRNRDFGRIFLAPCDVILAEDTVVQPDILFVSRDREILVRKRGIFGAPDLAIEILSASSRSRDTVRKLELYGRHGVREYWIVDPDRKRIDVFLLEGADLVRRARHDSGDVRSLAALPGFQAPLVEIFAGR